MTLTLTDDQTVTAHDHFLDGPAIAEWLKGCPSNEGRDQLMARYRRAQDEYQRVMAREQDIRARQTTLAREITTAPTVDPEDAEKTPTARSPRDRLVVEHSGLEVELSVLPDFREEAARAYLDVAQRLGQMIERQARAEKERCYGAGYAYVPELRDLRQKIEALPKPSNHEENMARLVEVQRAIQPHSRREEVCRRAMDAAHSRQRDDGEQRRFLAGARKGWVG